MSELDFKRYTQASKQASTPVECTHCELGVELKVRVSYGLAAIEQCVLHAKGVTNEL